MTKTKRKGLSHRERMAMAQTTAGISFWVDLRKGRLSRYTIQKRVKKAIALLFRYIILISLGFVILTPLLKLAKDALTDPSALASKSSVWIPQKVSTIFFEMSMTKTVLNYWPSLCYTLATTTVLTFFQVLSTGLAAYSFARLNKGKMKIVSKILFAMVIFTIVVPSDCIMLAQFSTFRSFDLFGIIRALTGSGINMTKNMASMLVLAATGMGVKSGLYIYILRQGIRGLPYSIEEAAFVDGAGFLRTFFQIVVPSASGSILTVSVLSFLWNYTDVYYNSLLNQNTLQLAYNYHQLQGNIRWPIGNAAKMHAVWLNLINEENPYVQNASISACALLVVLPLLILYCFVQKRFVQGAARSGLGGD